MLISIFGFSSKPKNITMGRANVVFEEIQTELTTGEWTLCSVMVINKATGISSQLMYNQGPKLIFNSNNTGIYIKPSSKHITFEWELLNEDSLSFKVVDENNQREAIKSGVYQIGFSINTEYKELQLKHVDNDLIYFLRK